MMLRLLLIVTLLAGCAATDPPAADPATESVDDIELVSALRPFHDCAALDARLRDRALDLVGPYGLQGPPQTADGAAAGAAGDVRAEAAPGAAGVTRGQAAEGAAVDAGVTGTNVQVAGVDEGDVAKTDGDWLYTVTDSALRVVDIRRDTPGVVATVPLDGGYGTDLLLSGDRLLVLGEAPPPDAVERDSAREIVPWTPRAQAWLVDVSAPTQPRMLSTMAIDGAMVATRLTGRFARVVVRSFVTPPGLVTPQASTRGDEQRAQAINRERVRQSSATDWLPRVQVDGRAPEPLVGCEAVHEPPEFVELGMVSVLTLDMRVPTLSPDRTQAVLGAGDTVYATAEHLYVTSGPWTVGIPGAPMPMPRPVDPAPMPVEPMPRPVDPAPMPTVSSALPPDVLEPLPSVASEVVPPDVSEPPPPDTLPAPPTEPQTRIHRFDMQGPTVTYVASGSIPGQLLNQWALSEHDGDLRVATTDDTAAQGSASSVRVLRERDGQLREIGHVGDLGRGERIYAVRYVGDLGFVVTFRQVDPLYTIDLSDPTRPRVLGELNIPGYSAYLHPVGDDMLLGIGQDADAQGRTRGVQVSLFDVGDLAAPRRLGAVALGADTTTPIEWDHHAFAYDTATATAVVPVESYAGGSTGAQVLTIPADGAIVRRGLVTHPHDGELAASVQRAFVIGDRLITLSPFDVLVSDLDGLAPLGRAPLAQ